MVLDWIKKVTDIIMPLEPLPEEEETEEKKVETKTVSQPVQATKQEVADIPVKKVATGGGTVHTAVNYSSGGGAMSTADNGTTSIGGMRYTAYTDPTASTPTARPSLTVVKPNDLTLKIYMPENFDQVSGIADDILNKKAAVVNYEKVGDADQRRISDFVNGVCYVTDGAVSMISEKIFLYLPAGVESGEIAKATVSMRIR